MTQAGQSAGGVSVCLHLTSPASKGLFAQALLMSPLCESALLTFPEPQATAFGLAYAHHLGCKGADGPDLVRCLRGLTTVSDTSAPPPPAMLFINENEKYICTYFGSSREDTDVGDALSLLLPEYGCNSPRPIVVFSRCCALQSPMYAEVRNSDGSSHYVPRLSSRQSCGYLKMISKAPDRCQG